MIVKDNLLKDVMKMGGDIVDSKRFAKARNVPHHSKDGSIAAHSLETACYALWLARWLNRHGVQVSEEDVVRASLLHDIGMTEDDVFLSRSSEKAHTHPLEGARIAREEFGANEKQVDAILQHMWPCCTMVPPHHAVGWVLTMADKLCSLNDVKRIFQKHQRQWGTEGCPYRFVKALGGRF